MQIKGILTERKNESWPSFDLVYEWEDCLSKELNIPLVYKKPTDYNLRARLIKYKLLRFYQIAKKIFLKRQGYYLYFILGVSDPFPVISRRKILPVIIDFFVPRSSLPRFYECFREFDCTLISSIDAYNYLKNEQIRLNIAHFPLSLSDTYKLTEKTCFEKKYNLLVAGRENPVLIGFLNTYTSKHPNFEYIYRKLEVNKFIYVSNQTGLIGEFGTRNEFVQLLRASKCVLYATPGIDGDEKRTNGFSPVTPRFFEFMAAGCFILARYSDNDETRFFELNSITPSIETYEEFENTLNEYLKKEKTPMKYVTYLKKHYTSERAKLLNDILNKKAYPK